VTTLRLGNVPSLEISNRPQWVAAICSRSEGYLSEADEARLRINRHGNHIGIDRRELAAQDRTEFGSVLFDSRIGPKRVTHDCQCVAI